MLPAVRPTGKWASFIAAPYKNSDSDRVLSLVPADARCVLDVGCGAGDNARRLLETRADMQVVGITHNPDEALMAAPFLAAVHTLDIEWEIKAGHRRPI